MDLWTKYRLLDHCVVQGCVKDTLCVTFFCYDENCHCIACICVISTIVPSFVMSLKVKGTCTNTITVQTSKITLLLFCKCKQMYPYRKIPNIRFCEIQIQFECMSENMKRVYPIHLIKQFFKAKMYQEKRKCILRKSNIFLEKQSHPKIYRAYLKCIGYI